MKQPPLSPTAQKSLESAGRRLDHWRQGHARGTRIPEDLWGLAVDCARQAGVAKVSQALGLDYYSLKRRLEARPARAPAALVASPAFLELLPLPALPTTGSGCVLELEDGRGVRLRAELTTVAAPEIEVVARALWRATR